MENEQQAQPQIDLTTTTAVNTGKGHPLFQTGVIIRKVSKFITGTQSDGMLPIPIFYDPKTMKILEASIPAELRDEYKDFSF